MPIADQNTEQLLSQRIRELCALKLFSGSRSQDVVLWFNNFNQKCDAIPLDDDERLMVACQLMKNDAKVLANLYQDTYKDWAIFQQKMTAIFRRLSRSIQSSYDQQLLNRRQKLGISVNQNYIFHRQHIDDWIRQNDVKFELNQLKSTAHVDQNVFNNVDQPYSYLIQIETEWPVGNESWHTHNILPPRTTIVSSEKSDRQESTQLNPQQQQISSSNSINDNDLTNVQVHVLSEQTKKLSVDNANLEKEINSKELFVKELQNEKTNLIRSNQQLSQKIQDILKQFQYNEEKLIKDLNETRILHMNQLNEYKHCIEQLELDNEKLRHEEIVRVESTTTTAPLPTLNNEERERFVKEIKQLQHTIVLNQQKEREYNNLKGKLIENIEEYKKKLNDLQVKHQSQENELRQEIERLKQDKSNQQQQVDVSHNELHSLQIELDEAKSIISKQEERHRQKLEQQCNSPINLQSKDVRNQVLNDNQAFDKCLSSCRQISTIESIKRTLPKEFTTVKYGHDRFHSKMHNIINTVIALVIRNILYVCFLNMALVNKKYLENQLQSTTTLVAGSIVVHHKHILWNLNYTILRTRVDF